MVLPALFGALSVVLGALLGLWPGAHVRWLAPVRAMAIGAGLAVVFAALLPEALSSLGTAALVPFAAGFAAPLLLERVLGHPPHPGEGRAHAAAFVGLELSYVGLLLHQLGDGLTMGAYAGPAHGGHAHFDVFLAIAGHTIPVTAAVALAFAEHRGRRSAAVRALLLMVPVVAGVALTRFGVAERYIAANEGWVSAGAGGLLLHVVLHGSHSHQHTGVRPGAPAAHRGRPDDHAHDHDHDHDHAHDHAEGERHAHAHDAVRRVDAPPSALRARVGELGALALGAVGVLLLLPAPEQGEPPVWTTNLGPLAAAAILVAALRFTLHHEPQHPSCATGDCARDPAGR
jgi:hypothetical protein